ncbi:hypothetical protein M8494_05380 [Serratia ureilytica]
MPTFYPQYQFFTPDGYPVAVARHLRGGYRDDSFPGAGFALQGSSPARAVPKRRAGIWPGVFWRGSCWRRSVLPTSPARGEDRAPQWPPGIAGAL